MTPTQRSLGDSAKTGTHSLLNKSQEGWLALGVNIQATDRMPHLPGFYFKYGPQGMRLERGRVLSNLLCTHTIVLVHTRGLLKSGSPAGGFFGWLLANAEEWGLFFSCLLFRAPDFQTAGVLSSGWVKIASPARTQGRVREVQRVGDGVRRLLSNCTGHTAGRHYNRMKHNTGPRSKTP